MPSPDNRFHPALIVTALVAGAGMFACCGGLCILGVLFSARTEQKMVATVTEKQAQVAHAGKAGERSAEPSAVEEQPRPDVAIRKQATKRVAVDDQKEKDSPPIVRLGQTITLGNVEVTPVA